MADLLTNYYLEAYDSYPYDLKQTSESLNYALAYDNEHAPSLCLMGKLLAEQMKSPREAAHYFELAIVFDQHFPDTYYAYIDLLLDHKHYAKAKEIMEKAEKVPSLCEACLYRRKSLWLEKQGMLRAAKNALNVAINVSTNNGEIDDLRSEMMRIKSKLKQKRKNN
jgi:tetratricopeptide (TPR) repeat protein